MEKDKFILALGDMHADKKSLDEIQDIFREVYYTQEHSIEEVWLLGDVFDKVKPCPETLDFVTKVLIDMQKNGKVIICVGNHETYSDIISTLDYSKHFGIELVRHHGTVVLNNRTIYLGHHFIDKGKIHRQDARYKLKDLKKYDLAFIGHDHQFTEFAKNVYYLGSVRRVGFNETDYGIPKYALIEPKTLEIKFCDIESAIPMKDIDSIEKLAQEPARAKIRLVFKSFEQFVKNVDQLKQFNEKFYTFVVKHDYKIQAEKKSTKKSKARTFDESFQKFIKTVKNKQVRKFITQCWEGENE